MTVKLLTEQHLVFRSLIGGCTGASESIHVKMPHCWKSYVAAYLFSSDALFDLINALRKLYTTFYLISAL